MPSEKIVSTGKSTGFEINASFPVMKYQWQYNKMNIIDGEKYSGAATDNLTITNIEKADGGNYSCIVTTVFGLDVFSQQAQLKICKGKLLLLIVLSP